MLLHDTWYKSRYFWISCRTGCQNQMSQYFSTKYVNNEIQNLRQFIVPYHDNYLKLVCCPALRLTWPSESAALHHSLFKRSIVSYLWNRVSRVVSAETTPQTSTSSSYNTPPVFSFFFLSNYNKLIHAHYYLCNQPIVCNITVKHDHKHFLSPWPRLNLFWTHSGVVLLLLRLWLRLLIVLPSTAFTHWSPEIFLDPFKQTEASRFYVRGG